MGSQASTHMPVGFAALAAAIAITACAPGKSVHDRGVEVAGDSVCHGYKIKKEPISRVEEGPVLIYTYEMSGPGCPNYQLIVVPAEESKSFVVGLLKGLNVIKDSTPSVSTLKERIDGDAGEAKYKEPRVAKLTADLQSHAAIVELYVNTASQPINR